MNLYSFNASGPDRSNEPPFVEQLGLQVELSSNLSAFYENHELYTWSRYRYLVSVCGVCVCVCAFTVAALKSQGFVCVFVCSLAFFVLLSVLVASLASQLA